MTNDSANFQWCLHHGDQSASPTSSTAVFWNNEDDVMQQHPDKITPTPFRRSRRSLPTVTTTTTTPQKPLKGILKAPSLSSFSNHVPPSTRRSSKKNPMRRAVTDSFADASQAAASTEGAPAKSHQKARRCVSFSDMCRWQNQGSSHCLNTMPNRRPERKTGRRSCTTRNATLPPRTSSQEDKASGCNQVWKSKSSSLSSSSSFEPFLKKKVPTASKPPAPALRKPRRRGSNEFTPTTTNTTAVEHTAAAAPIKPENVFQTSVNSFLMNARAPARTTSSNCPFPAAS